LRGQLFVSLDGGEGFKSLGEELSKIWRLRAGEEARRMNPPAQQVQAPSRGFTSPVPSPFTERVRDEVDASASGKTLIILQVSLDLPRRHRQTIVAQLLLFGFKIFLEHVFAEHSRDNSVLGQRRERLV
jgi:hypothetical protein